MKRKRTWEEKFGRDYQIAYRSRNAQSLAKKKKEYYEAGVENLGKGNRHWTDMP